MATISDEIFFKLDNLSTELGELLLNAMVVDTYFMYNNEKEASEQNPYERGNHYMVAGSVFRNVYQRIEQVEETVYSILDAMKEQEHRERIYRVFSGETSEERELFKKKQEDKQESLAKLSEKYGDKVAGVIYENVHAQFINTHQKGADTFGQAWNGLDSSILADITFRAVNGLPRKEKDNVTR